MIYLTDLFLVWELFRNFCKCTSSLSLSMACNEVLTPPLPEKKIPPPKMVKKNYPPVIKLFTPPPLTGNKKHEDLNLMN